MEETALTNVSDENDVTFEVTTKRKSSRWFTDLLPVKATYFFGYIAIGAYVPFAMLFFVSMGLTVTQAGLLNGIRIVFAVIAAFVSGYIVDRTGKKKRVLLTLLTLNFFVALSTPFALYPFYNKSNNKVGNINITIPQNNMSYSSNGNQTNVKTIEVAANQSLFYFSLFWLSMLAMTGYPTLSLIDSAVTILVKSHKGKASYGMQRVFAPIGYTIGSLLCGLVVDIYTPTHGLSKYTALFMFQIPFFILYIISTSLIKMEVKKEKVGDNEQIKQSILKCLFLSCKNFSFVVFLFTLLVNGVSYNIVNSYLLLLLKEMEVSNTAMGLTVALASAGEIIMFPFSKLLLPLFGGVYSCFCIAVFSFSIRFFMYYIGSSIWYVLLAQLLHMFGYALFWVAVIEYTYENTPSKISQSMFSLVTIIFYMISSVIASTAGGFFFDLIGGRNLFLMMSIICGGWGVVLILFYLFVERFKKKLISNDMAEKQFVK